MNLRRIDFSWVVVLTLALPSTLLAGCDDVPDGDDGTEDGDGDGDGDGDAGTGGTSDSGASGGAGSGGADHLGSGGQGGQGGDNNLGSGGANDDEFGCPDELPSGDCTLGDSLACDGYIYPFVSVHCSCVEGPAFPADAPPYETPQWFCVL